MRWQDLFADLEGMLRHAERLERESEVAERTRHERAEVSWLDRAAASLGCELTVGTAGGRVRGRLDDLGQDWLLLEETSRRTVLVPTASVDDVVGLRRQADGYRGMGRRFGLVTALRAISRDRAAVALHHRSGTVTTGTIDVVGQDYVEVAEHPADVTRRGAAVTGQRVVTFAGLDVLRRAG